MDIITNQGLTAQQPLKHELRSVEAVPTGRPATQADASVAQAQEVPKQDKQALEEAVASMQDATQAMQRNLSFSIDESTGRMVVKVTDSSSGDVIRQMPTEEALRLAESLDEMRSLLFKAQA